MNKIKSLISLAVTVALCGCVTTSTIQNAVIKKGVSEAVKYGATKWPDSKPYVAAVGPVVCSVAAGTNLSPDAVISALETSTIANAVKTDSGAIVANMVIAVYSGAWELWGADAVKNSAALKGALQATCDGINDGLSNRTRAMRRYLQ